MDINCTTKPAKCFPYHKISKTKTTYRTTYQSFKIPWGSQKHLCTCKETQTVISKTTGKAFANLISYGNMWNADSNLLSKKLNDAYKAVVHWKKSLFLLHLRSV